MSITTREIKYLQVALQQHVCRCYFGTSIGDSLFLGFFQLLLDEFSFSFCLNLMISSLIVWSHHNNNIHEQVTRMGVNAQ